MFERFPILTILLIVTGVVVFGLVTMALWLTVGLIWTTAIVIGALLAAPWLFTHRPRFLRHN